MTSTDYRSSKNTDNKQTSLRHILATIMAIIGAVKNKPLYQTWKAIKRPILYFDLFAGPGREPKTSVPGSPLIFLELAAQQSYRFIAHFYEQDPIAFWQLEANCQRVCPPNVLLHLHNESNVNVKTILKQEECFGIAYADPSNADLNGSFELLRVIAQAYGRVDIILNYAAASWKRQRRLEHYQNLLNHLNQTPKNRWLIRKPLDKFQWTMLLGTNYLMFKTPEKQQWYDINQPEGRQLLDRIAYTHKDLDDGNSDE